jgi:hypothetical protein
MARKSLSYPDKFAQRSLRKKLDDADTAKIPRCYQYDSFDLRGAMTARNARNSLRTAIFGGIPRRIVAVQQRRDPATR